MRSGRLVGAAETSEELAEWRRVQWKNEHIGPAEKSGFSVTEKANRRDGVVARASTSQLVDLGFTSQVESYQKTLKMVVTAPLLGAQQIGIVRRTGRQACLCLWARHLMGFLDLYAADRCWG